MESIRIRPWLIYLVTTRLNNQTLPLNNRNLQNHSNATPYEQLHQVALADKAGELDITYFPDCSVNSSIGKADAKQANVSKDPARIAQTIDFMKGIQGARAQFDYHFMRLMPGAVQRWCLAFFAKEKMKKKEVFKVPVKTISDMIRETKVEKIDVLKVCMVPHGMKRASMEKAVD